MGDKEDVEAELIKRNREIAKVRDDLLKMEKRLEESHMRNDDLLEKVSELDGEVNKKNIQIAELEAKMSQYIIDMEGREKELKSLREDHGSQLDNLRKDLEQKAGTREQDLETQEKLKAQMAAVEAAKEELAKELENEKGRHKTTKNTLELEQSSGRELAGRAQEQRKLKELQDLLAEKEAHHTNLSSGHADALVEERERTNAELHKMSMELLEHKGVREDLEQQHNDREQKLHSLRAELEELQRANDNHEATKSILEAARDEAEKKLEEANSKNDDVAQLQRKQQQEDLHRANAKAAQLDGRLNSQRMMMEEMHQELIQTQKEKDQQKKSMEDKVRDLEKEVATTKDALLLAEEKAANDISAQQSKHISDMEAEQVAAKARAKQELDAAQRETQEVEEKCKRLEAQIQSLQMDHEEAHTQHSRLQESLRGQHTDLRAKLAETEDARVNHQQEVEKLNKDIQEKHLEQERMHMSHRLEVERLQQTLEAEAQSRASAEKIAQSKLEEKETLIEHRVSAIERLEQELEEAKKKITQLEDQVKGTREDGDGKVAAMGVRNAQLEGELKKRQERLTEAEGRLEAQRQYLEQINDTLEQAKNEKDKLMENKGSLEAELKLASSHKDAVNLALQDQQEEWERRCKELEERILRDRDSHREESDKIRQSVADELRQGAERHAALEAELLTARQRCELLVRNKADLQQEVEESRGKHATHQANVAEKEAANQQLRLELDQHKTGKESAEGEVASLKEEKRKLESSVEELHAKVKETEGLSHSQIDDFKLKVQKLDEMLNSERDSHEGTKRTLLKTTQDHESKYADLEAAKRKVEQDILEKDHHLETWRGKAEDLEVQHRLSKEQVEAHKSRVEETDNQRREVEAQLRGEIATCEARLRRLEAEAQRSQSAVEDGKVALAQQQAMMTAKIQKLERELEDKSKAAKQSHVAKELAEGEVQKHSDTRSQLQERLGMAAEELFTRQVTFALEKQRLSGALEESRRTLRNTLGGPSQTQTVDTVRVTGLQQQLAEERRKAIEQAVALQRAERKSNSADQASRRSEEQRDKATQQAREAERRCVGLSEDLRKSQVKLKQADERNNETRERGAMTAAEMYTVRYEAKYESAKLRGALEELRFMIKLRGSAEA